MTDQGRSALAERLEAEWHAYPPTVQAERILGEHGLFIADIRDHEPILFHPRFETWFVGCSCGWEQTIGGSFYAHIVGAP